MQGLGLQHLYITNSGALLLSLQPRKDPKSSPVLIYLFPRSANVLEMDENRLHALCPGLGMSQQLVVSYTLKKIFGSFFFCCPQWRSGLNSLV